MTGASTSSSGFARRPAGTGNLARETQRARDRLDELRSDLAALKRAAAEQPGAALVELDLLRAMTALGHADQALKRAHRHVRLEQ
jgi:hypothetical protein